MSSTRIAARLQQTAVKPLLSSNRNDARFRVMRLYKAWFRQAAFVAHEYDIPLDVETIQKKIRSEFDKNRHVTDIRVIDMLVVKGQQELVEIANIWQQKIHVMNKFKVTEIKKTDDFLTNFYEGHHS